MHYWIRLIVRSFREGSTQLWRNKFLSTSTIFLGALIIVLLNFIFGIEHYADISLKRLEQKADFVALLVPGYSVFELESLENDLDRFDVNVERKPVEVREGIEIPKRLSIQFQDLEDVTSVFEVLKQNRYSVLFQDWDHDGEREFREVVDQLLKIRTTVDQVGFWMTIVFVIGGVFLGLNTFRIVLFSRKEEVFIARLVGAEHRFISWPFLWEGVLIGFLSALLGIIVFILILRQVYFLPGADIFLSLLNRNIFSYEIYIAGGVGFLGAFVAIRKYLLGKFSQ